MQLAHASPVLVISICCLKDKLWLTKLCTESYFLDPKVPNNVTGTSCRRLQEGNRLASGYLLGVRKGSCISFRTSGVLLTQWSWQPWLMRHSLSREVKVNRKNKLTLRAFSLVSDVGKLQISSNTELWCCRFESSGFYWAGSSEKIFEDPHLTGLISLSTLFEEVGGL